MIQLIIKTGQGLFADEGEQINRAKAREFKAPPLERILALGGVIPVESISFNGEQFSILGIGGIAANEKGKGYGRQIITAIKDYLSKLDKTGVGFCAMRNKGFYEKCGFKVNSEIIRRFIFKEKGKTITNKEDDCVIYYEGADGFMNKVLSAPNQEILLPRKPDW